MMIRKEDIYSSPRFTSPPIHCMSLACEQGGGCAPIRFTNGVPVYPPDCATGAAQPGHPYGDDMVPGVPVEASGGPIGQEPGASAPAPFNLGEIFGGMSTTTLLLLGGAAYFLFFRKGR